MITDRSDLPAYDPTSEQTLENPFPEYAQRRASACPIAPVDSLEVPFWTLFGYDDIRAALLNPKTYSNRYGNTPVFQKSIGFFADAPAHTHFRAIFRKRLSPESLAALKPRVQQLAEDLLTDMLAKGPLVELHDDFALPLPVKVVSILLGIPGEDYFRLKHWSDALMDNAFGKDNQAFLDVYQGVCEFFDGFLDQRYAILADAGIDTPGPEHVGTVLPDDWISDAICADYMGRKLTRDEQRIALMGLLVGGNETTTSLITNIMWRLLEQPGRWEQVKSDPEGLIPVAIEESLRFDAPTLATFRTTLCPTKVAGVELEAKQKLMMAYGSANRDPAMFEDPETFRLDRDLKTVSRHLAFGAGPHSCPGAPLSRMEVALVLHLFVARMPDVAIAGPAERSVGYNFWGRRSLPLRIG